MIDLFEPLYFAQSPARQRFKKALGQANHFTITILVGLSAIESGLITDIPEYLHAAWSPDDPVVSAKRSASYALESIVVRATDALDTYLAECRSWPSLFQQDRLRNAVDRSEGRALPRLRAVIRESLWLTPVASGLVKTMFAWRNKIVHSRADTSVDDSTRVSLAACASLIADRYHSLDVNLLFEHFDARRSPALKEAASFVRATQDFVEEVDRGYLTRLDWKTYLLEAIASETRTLGIDAAERARLRKKRVSAIWGRDKERRSAAILGALRSLGFSQVQRSDDWPLAILSVDDFDALRMLSVKEAYEQVDRLSQNPDSTSSNQ